MLKTSSGTIINENYQVTHNHPYGNLPTVDVSNSSFIHWTLEDGTVISNDSLVATKEPHELIAVISPVVAPVIQASTTNWTANDVTISIMTPGSADKGIKHYEYLITDKGNPSSQDEPTGNTSGTITVSNVGTKHIFYRTIANDDVYSSWSNEITTKIDKTAPTNVSFSNKVVDVSNVTMNVNYIENESESSIKCLYGDSSSQTSNGTLNGNTCVYPATAEYAKVCVSNSVGQETCSTSKKLANYFIKDGIQQVEFLTYTPMNGTFTASQGDGYYQFEVGSRDLDSGRGGIYTKNTYDFTNIARGYYDFEAKQENRPLNDGPHIESTISDYIWFTGGSVPYQSIICIGDVGGTPNGSASFVRKTYSGVPSLTSRDNVYVSFGKNSSRQFATVKIYNIWYQLTN